MGSTRLPGKVLMKLEDKTILEHIVHSIKLSKNINEIIIATSTLEEDDQIVAKAKKNNIKCFRGSSENVLERFYKCAKYSKADLIVRITADNPIIEPSLIDMMIKESINGKFDYVSNVLDRSFPVGFTSCEIFTFDVLSKLYHEQKDPLSLEHVTYHIRQNQKYFKIKSVITPNGLDRSKWQLTIDNKEDLAIMRKIFSEIYVPGMTFEYKKLVDFLDKNPELIKSNP